MAGKNLEDVLGSFSAHFSRDLEVEKMRQFSWLRNRYGELYEGCEEHRRFLLGEGTLILRSVTVDEVVVEDVLLGTVENVTDDAGHRYY